LRKRENNRLFSRNNPGYWWGRYAYVKQWRQRHPDYQRQWRQARGKSRSSGEIQAERLRKAIEFTERLHLYLREIQAEILLKAFVLPVQKASFILQAP
jgi:ferric-dicitrate binding protein FerR (iron transport regulator)